ncbi:MAG: hypothetical protein R3F50_00775 [Gammaproteobacteria bacterium]
MAYGQAFSVQGYMADWTDVERHRNAISGLSGVAASPALGLKPV